VWYQPYKSISHAEINIKGKAYVFLHSSSIEICRLECYHGTCRNQKCVCDHGWGGALCDQLRCDHRCDGVRGFCNNGTCECRKGWNGKHCSLGRGLDGLFELNKALIYTF